MHLTILQTLMVFGLIVGASTMASASQSSNLLGREAALRPAVIEQASYYWNHHRYKHRSWNKKSNGWRYY